MKFVYIFIFIIFAVVLLLAKSMFSSAGAIKNSLTSSASGFQRQGQYGGKKANKLMTLLYVVLAIIAVIFILSKLNK